MSARGDEDDAPVFEMPERFWDKGIRKCKENPFVPIGVLCTVGFLGGGFRAFQRGEKKKMQVMMRGRVLAQAFTLVVIAGTYYFTTMDKNKKAQEVEHIVLERAQSQSAADGKK